MEGVGDHANGARSVSSVAVAVKDLKEAVRLNSVLFDVEPFRRDEVTDLTATRASFDVRGFTIDILSPTGNGPVRKALESDGEGPFEVKYRGRGSHDGPPGSGGSRGERRAG